MKRTTSILLVLVLALTVSGCWSQPKLCDKLYVTTADGKVHVYGEDHATRGAEVSFRRSGDDVEITETFFYLDHGDDDEKESSLSGVTVVECKGFTK